jgi:hypothetical protein
MYEDLRPACVAGNGVDHRGNLVDVVWIYLGATLLFKPKEAYYER